ncbi:MAG: FMN-binding protein [Flavobacteriaceae bacterium]
MIKRTLIFGLFYTLFVSFLVPEEVGKKADKVIRDYFEKTYFSKEIISISPRVLQNLPASFSEDNFFKIIDQNKLLGYGFIGNAPSKTATFDYLVLFDEDWIILKSKVLIYREEYGGEIASKRWLKQFEGNSSSAQELLYVKDIIPISGATISSQSMTKAINNLLKSIKLLQQEKII